MSPAAVTTAVERLRAFGGDDLEDLCEATVAAIEDGGGFGWVKAPARTVLETYWNGVLLVPERVLFVARLNGTICGAVQLVAPPKNNEAQAFAAQLTGNFLAPWSRGHGLARRWWKRSRTRRAPAASPSSISTCARRRKPRSGSTRRWASSAGARIPPMRCVDGKVIPGYFYFKRLAGRAKGRP